MAKSKKKRIEELQEEIKQLQQKQHSARTQQEHEDCEIAIRDNYELINTLRS